MKKSLIRIAALLFILQAGAACAAEPPTSVPGSTGGSMPGNPGAGAPVGAAGTGSSGSSSPGAVISAPINSHNKGETLLERTMREQAQKRAADEAAASAAAHAPVAHTPAAHAPDTKVTECKPDGYVGRRVIAPGEKVAPGSTDIDPATIKHVRVLLPDSIVTMDYSAERLNLTIDKVTRIVLEAKCG